MSWLSSRPLEQALAERWIGIEPPLRKAFFAVLAVNLLAFGFEMTNLTLHHDDVNHFFAGPLVGYYLGRFGHAWLHYYAQGSYFMPFLQMALGISLMAAYGVLVAHFWGMRRTLDVALVAAVITVFPYMAQIYQYNTAMVAYPAAHLLAASAVIVSTRARLFPVTVGALLFVSAFSIYQAVLANAATVFMVWLLSCLLFRAQEDRFCSRTLLRSTVAAIVSVVAGGLIYVAIVASLNIDFDAAQGADKAFSLSYRLEHGFPVIQTISAVLKGTRGFFFWPENYFPDLLKKLQILLVAGAAIYCLFAPSSLWKKAAALALLVMACLAPRTMQFLHPHGSYHNLTLTSYALVVAGTLMVLLQSRRLVIRNLSALLALVLIGGYVIQSNWISTVSYLNTLAHYSTMTQVLSRIGSLPREGWDGQSVAVVGKLEMYAGYPFLRTTGVASEFIDARHAQNFARLLRNDLTFVEIAKAPPAAREFAQQQPPWPHPNSVGVAGGMAVLVLSKPSD